jgi:putative transposase
MPRPGWSATSTQRTPVPDQELIQLTRAARTAGHSWASVAAACQVRPRQDTEGIVFGVVCDGLKGLPEVVEQAWPAAIVQTCVVHLIRNTFHLASKRDWDALRRDVKPIYTAVSAQAARAALDQLAETWGTRYPAIIRVWDNAWEQFIPFLDYDVEIRKVLCSTNASR